MCDAIITTFDVVCNATCCPAQGVPKTVQLPMVGDGIVASPTLLCVRCGCTPQAIAQVREPQ